MSPTHACRNDRLHDKDLVGHVLIHKKAGVLFRVGWLVLMNRISELDESQTQYRNQWKSSGNGFRGSSYLSRPSKSDSGGNYITTGSFLVSLLATQSDSVSGSDIFISIQQVLLCWFCQIYESISVLTAIYDCAIALCKQL